MLESPSITYVFDIDGTLTAERYVNDNVKDLRPNWVIVNLARSLGFVNTGGFAVVTARPEYLRPDTEVWLEGIGLEPRFLLMRSNFDRRPDESVRVDQVREAQRMAGNKVVLFDDRAENCRAVREELKVPCVYISQNARL